MDVEDSGVNLHVCKFCGLGMIRSKCLQGRKLFCSGLCKHKFEAGGTVQGPYHNKIFWGFKPPKDGIDYIPDDEGCDKC